MSCLALPLFRSLADAILWKAIYGVGARRSSPIGRRSSTVAFPSPVIHGASLLFNQWRTHSGGFLHRFSPSGVLGMPLPMNLRFGERRTKFAARSSELEERITGFRFPVPGLAFLDPGSRITNRESRSMAFFMIRPGSCGQKAPREFSCAPGDGSAERGGIAAGHLARRGGHRASEFALLFMLFLGDLRLGLRWRPTIGDQGSHDVRRSVWPAELRRAARCRRARSGSPWNPSR